MICAFHGDLPPIILSLSILAISIRINNILKEYNLDMKATGLVGVRLTETKGSCMSIVSGPQISKKEFNTGVPAEKTMT